MRNTIVSALLSAVALSPLAYSSPIGNVPAERDLVWDNTPPAPTVINAVIDDQTPAATTKKTRSRASRPAPTAQAPAPTAPAGGAPAGAAPSLTYLPGAQGTLGAPGSQITWGPVNKRQEESETIGNPESTTSFDEGEAAAPPASPSEDSETTIESREPDVADTPAKAPPKWGSWGAPKPKASDSTKKPQGFRADPNPAPLPVPASVPAPQAAPPAVPVPEPVVAPVPVPVSNPAPVYNPAPVVVPAANPAPPKPAAGTANQGSPVVYSPDGSASLQISDSSISFFPSDGSAPSTAHSGESTYGGSISNQISRREAEAAEAAKPKPRPNSATGSTSGGTGSQGLTITSSGVTFYPSNGGASTTVTTSGGRNGKRDGPIINSPAPGVWESLGLVGSTTTFWPASGAKGKKVGVQERRFVA